MLKKKFYSMLTFKFGSGRLFTTRSFQKKAKPEERTIQTILPKRKMKIKNTRKEKIPPLEKKTE